MTLSSVAMLMSDLIDKVSETHGEDAVIRMMYVAIEVDAPTATYLVRASTDDRPWVQMAFLERVEDELEDELDGLSLRETEGDDE